MPEKQYCIYCGKNPGTTQDHIPPRGFFQKKCPNDAQLITVPCCEECRIADQKDDPFMRNLLSGLLETEASPYVQKHITGRVSRSIQRGTREFHQLIQILKAKEATIITPGGPQFATLPAFDLNIPEVDRFFNRIGRAVLYDSYGLCFFQAKVDWIPNVTMPGKCFSFMIAQAQCRSILDAFFYSATPLIKNTVRWVYVKFYGTVNFMIRFKECGTGSEIQPADGHEF